MTERRTATLGPAFDAGNDEAIIIDLGAQHPSMHGGLRIALTLDGEAIATAEPHVGYLHRGAEKLFEVRDYRASLALANRHDWLSAHANEIGLCLVLERMLGLEVPPRAIWLRTMLVELNRALSHLAFLAAIPGGGPDLVRHVWDMRERLLEVIEELTGGRMHVMVARVGGLKVDVPAGWLGRVEAAVAAVRADLAGIDAALTSDAVLSLCRGVAKLPIGAVTELGLSGAVARASGADLDLRRDDPVLGYAELGFGGAEFPVVLRSAGDALARFEVLAQQTAVALDLVDAARTRLAAEPSGPIDVRLPKTLKAPEGVAYAWTENPLGAMGYLLVSRGERTPWRLHLRTPSFANVQAMRVALPGTRVDQLEAALASFFFIVGDIDR